MATSYSMERRTPPGTGTFGDSVAVSIVDGELRHSFTGLVAETDYEFRIAATTGGVTRYSTPVTARTGSALGVPDGGTISTLGSFTLGTTPQTATGATLTRSTSYSLINFSNNSWQTVGITFNPGTGEQRWCTKGALTDHVLDINKTYLEQSGTRSVTVKLPSTQAFALVVDGAKKITVSVTSPSA
jgi:hypothetical protein